MSGPKARMSAADIEAAEWHGRLGGRNVDARMIEDFFTWRQSPANAEAYRRVETVWSGTGKLAADPQVNEALEAAFSRRTQRRRPPRLLLGLAAVGAAAALAGASVSGCNPAPFSRQGWGRSGLSNWLTVLLYGSTPRRG